MQEVLIIAIIFAVPLSAIIGSFWMRVKRMEFEAGGRDLDPRLRALESENRELRQRVETLETIVTSDEPRRAATTRIRVQAPETAAPPAEAAEHHTEAARSTRANG